VAFGAAPAADIADIAEELAAAVTAEPEVKSGLGSQLGR
jgi:hypothetical protein